MKIAWIGLLVAFFLAGCGGGGGSSSDTPSAPAALLGGWGGGTVDNPASLQVTSAGGTLNLACGVKVTLNQPLTTDSTGHFSVAASQTVPFAIGSIPVQLSGSVSSNQMTITETPVSATGQTYTLTLGQAAPIYEGVCPG